MLAAALNAGRALPECTIIASMILHRLNFSPALHRARFTAYISDDETFDASLAEMFEAMATRAGGECPVLKAPELLYVLPHLHRFFRREMRTVCLVRDPRDVIASLMQVRERQGEPRDLIWAANFCGDYYQALSDGVESAHKRNPVLCVRYESLVASSNGTRGELERFVGTSLSTMGMRVQSTAPSNPWHSELFTRPITAERVGSYKDYLTPDEIGAIDESYARFYERFGYARHEEQEASQRRAA